MKESKQYSMKKNNEFKGHIIHNIAAGSIAEELELLAGDRLLSMNGQEINDIFDYQYLAEDTKLEILIEKQNGEQWILEVEKDEDENLGIEFDNGLMDDYRSCHNKCVFCFIDQMPKGMRDTLYFKDDDSRLSFLQGNYITLTNLSDDDLNRMIKYRLAPINISFQTMNPELRCKMLNNRFAGEALNKVDKLYDAGLAMNGQIVLCKGLNDGKELDYSISKLAAYLPYLESVSVVPVGLSKYRDGLFPLESFDRESAKSVLEIIRRWQIELYQKHGTHFVHASDEWYILAEEPLPEEENYDEYLQLENGVGMLRLLVNEFEHAVKALEENTENERWLEKAQTISMATGKLAFPYIKHMADIMMQHIPNLTIKVFEITNQFFGEKITVSGLLTGQDIMGQLAGQELGKLLLLPENVLRSGEAVFLDDVTTADMEKALQVQVDIVKSSGYDFVEAVCAAARR